MYVLTQICTCVHSRGARVQVRISQACPTYIRELLVSARRRVRERVLLHSTTVGSAQVDIVFTAIQVLLRLNVVGSCDLTVLFIY